MSKAGLIKRLVLSTAMMFLVGFFALQQNAEAVSLTIDKGVNIYTEIGPVIPYNENGNEVHPFLYEGKTYLPLRAITDFLGCEVEENQETKEIFVTTGGEKVLYERSSNPLKSPYKDTVEAETGFTMYIDGEQFFPTDANGNPAEIYRVNGSIFAPVRAMSEALGIEIEWDSHIFVAFIGGRISDAEFNERGIVGMVERIEYYNPIFEKYAETMADNDFAFGLEMFYQQYPDYSGNAISFEEGESVVLGNLISLQLKVPQLLAIVKMLII